MEAMQQRQFTMHTQHFDTPQQKPQQKPAQKAAEAQPEPTNVCPKCGTSNEPSALFCENCGTSLRSNTCPNCGVEIEAGLDYCEHCRQYIDSQHCSFCGGVMSDADTFCTTCGCQRGGVMCPVCQTMSRFSFCERCAQPLTDSARRELSRAWDVPFVNEMRQLEAEFEQLMMTVPLMGYDDRKRQHRADEIRRRVLELLDADHSTLTPPVHQRMTERPSAAEHADRLRECRLALQDMLDRMTMAPQPSGAVARNVAMARRPRLSRLGWRCNWKNALHPSPLNCACPQQGGKWIVIDDKTEKELEED